MSMTDEDLRSWREQVETGKQLAASMPEGDERTALQGQLSALETEISGLERQREQLRQLERDEQRERVLAAARRRRFINPQFALQIVERTGALAANGGDVDQALTAVVRKYGPAAFLAHPGPADAGAGNQGSRPLVSVNERVNRRIRDIAHGNHLVSEDVNNLTR